MPQPVRVVSPGCTLLAMLSLCPVCMPLLLLVLLVLLLLLPVQVMAQPVARLAQRLPGASW